MKGHIAGGVKHDTSHKTLSLVLSGEILTFIDV